MGIRPLGLMNGTSGISNVKPWRKVKFRFWEDLHPQTISLNDRVAADALASLVEQPGILQVLRCLPGLPLAESDRLL